MNLPSTRTIYQFIRWLRVVVFLGFMGLGLWAFFQPRLYTAAVTFELLDKADTPLVSEAFQKAKEEYATHLKIQPVSSVKLESLESDQFKMAVDDTSPQMSATVANAMAILIAGNLQTASKQESLRMKVLQKAEVPKKPSHPDVERIFRNAVSVVVVIGIICFVLVRMANARAMREAQ